MTRIIGARLRVTTSVLNFTLFLSKMFRPYAVVLSNVACLEFASGEYVNAKALFQEALALRRNICVDECAKTSKDGSNNESKDALKSPIADSQIEEDISFRALELSLKAGYVFKETPGGDRNEKNYLDCTRMVAVLEERKKIDDMLSDSCNNMAACCEVEIRFCSFKKKKSTLSCLV